MSGIETSTRCSCGTYVVLHHGRRWEATCTSCYGPVEDSPATEMVRGIGETPLDALSDWQEQHDDAWDVTLVVTDLFGDLAAQVSEESERQQGWVNHYELNYACETCAIHYGPESP